jgi:hypothetical protein
MPQAEVDDPLTELNGKAVGKERNGLRRIIRVGSTELRRLPVFLCKQSWSVPVAMSQKCQTCNAGRSTYSISSSAVASTADGVVRPSALDHI